MHFKKNELQNKFGLVKEIVRYHDAQNAKQKHCFPPLYVPLYFITKV